jgi:hypothetical protein
LRQMKGKELRKVIKRKTKRKETTRRNDKHGENCQTMIEQWLNS